MQSSCKITVNLLDFSIKEGKIEDKHWLDGEEDLNYRLIYFKNYDVLYSRGIVLPYNSKLEVEEVQKRIDKARKILEDKYNKVIFCSTDEDCPEKLIELAGRC